MRVITPHKPISAKYVCSTFILAKTKGNNQCGKCENMCNSLNSSNARQYFWYQVCIYVLNFWEKNIIF